MITGIGHEIDSQRGRPGGPHRRARRPPRAPRTWSPGPRSFHDRVDQRLGRDRRAGRAPGPRSTSRRLATQGRATALAAPGRGASRRPHRRRGRPPPGPERRAGPTEHALAAPRQPSRPASARSIPRRALERGWSITRPDDGTLVRSSADARRRHRAGHPVRRRLGAQPGHRPTPPSTPPSRRPPTRTDPHGPRRSP